MSDARWKPNVTVAAIAGRPRAGTDETEWLLVEEETATGLRLNNPAGHLDRGETLVQAVVRETLEETARRFVPERVVGVWLAPSRSDPAVTYLRFAFAGSVGDAEPGLRLDHGIVRTLWLTVDEIRASRERHRSPLVLTGVEDAIAGRGFPLDRLGNAP
jgi:8-oxo-dGTP pyrophosphatase MutT (NUDIX family)